jgi:hypothetical protein
VTSKVPGEEQKENTLRFDKLIPQLNKPLSPSTSVQNSNQMSTFLSVPYITVGEEKKISESASQ